MSTDEILEALLELGDAPMPLGTIVVNKDGVYVIACPKCGAESGDSWDRCEGSCPLPFSPHYDGGAKCRDEK